MLGSKLYIDFTNPDQFNDSIDKLNTELGRSGVFASSDNKHTTSDTPTSGGGGGGGGGNLKHWSEEEIGEWATANSVPLDEVG